jgi:hypothetical protein
MRSSLFAVIALGALGCNTGPRSSAVVLSVSASRTELQPGQVDTIVVTTTNATDQSVTLNFPSSCQVVPYVRQVGGTVVLPSGGAWGCRQVLTQLQLAPRESVRGVYVWSGSDAFVSGMPLRSLPPGEYEVFANLQAQELATAAMPVRIRLRAAP